MSYEGLGSLGRQDPNASRHIGSRWDPSGDPNLIPNPVLRQAAIRILDGLRRGSGPMLEDDRWVREHLLWLAEALDPDRPAGGEVTPRFQVDGTLVGLLLPLLVSELSRELPTRFPSMLNVYRAADQIWRRYHEADAEVQPEPKEHAAGNLDLLVELAHDIRSPLTSIITLCEGLRKNECGDVNELQRYHLGLIYSSALSLSSLTSDIIELVQGSERLAEPEPVPFSIEEVLDGVCEILLPLAEQRGLMLRTLPPEHDTRIGLPVALSRVLLNLTTNALKYTTKGFVEVVTTPKGPDRIEFSVRDTGDGVDPELIRRVKDRAFTRAGAGSEFSLEGLGLAICFRLVRTMGSELEVESQPSWGTRFFFELELPTAP